MTGEAWVAIVAVVVAIMVPTSGGMIIAIWHFSKVLSRLETKMEAVSTTLSVIHEGKFPACVAHTMRMEQFEKTLAQHATEIDQLWTLLREDANRRNDAEPERVVAEFRRVNAEDGRVVEEAVRQERERERE